MTGDSDEQTERAKARQYGLEYVPPRLIDTSGYLAGLLLRRARTGPSDSA
jgi:hypothetical protein